MNYVMHYVPIDMPIRRTYTRRKMTREQSDRLRFAVDFARRDLATATKSEWQRLQDQLYDFLAGGLQRADRGIVAATSHHSLPWSQDDVRALQGDVSKLLRGLVEARARGGGGILPGLEIHGPVHIAFMPFADGRTGLLLNDMGQAPIRSIFLLVLALLLNREPSPRVQRCPEATCEHQLFYRVRKQRYCSPACVTRANKRRYRATPQGRAKEKVWQRKKYEKRVAIEFPRAKVAHRTRRSPSGGSR